VVPEKVEVIYNWCDEASIGVATFTGESVKASEFSGKFVVLFAGAIGTAQGLDTVLDCARLCRELLPEVQFVMIGEGVERPRLQKRAAKMGLENVTFLPPRPMETMGEIYALSDALLVHLKNDPLYRITIPSKTQAYLYIAKPIIMAVHGDAADLIREAGAGIVCDPDDCHKLINVIKILRDMPTMERQKMGEAGHCYYMNRLSFNKGVNQFERIMRSLGKKAA
jgi:colanic acid biosynthesis glycosyl transferase WcaI